MLLATGANLDLARKAGVDLRPGREPRIAEIIAVDADGRTSVAGIWAAGVSSLVTKPIDEGELLDTMGSLLEQGGERR